MNINIYGSTGIIGEKSLNLIKQHYSNLKINLLVANKNYKKLIIQSKIYKPKAVYLNDASKIHILRKNINKKIKILEYNELDDYLNKKNSEFSLLCISGYESLYYLNIIFKYTKYLGLVNKEAIVSAGHLFYDFKKLNNTKIFPLDSEHFSLFKSFDNETLINFNKVYITASGGPFFKFKLSDFRKITPKIASKHPKWKMGFKNSVDSATLANKCLEIIEAHYLFDIPFDKLDALIHPEALIHSIVDYNDFTSQLNYFYHDMEIPILNFLNLSVGKININFLKENKFKYRFKVNSNFNFFDIDKKKFKIYDIFLQLNKKSIPDIIKFNIANEYAVSLFKNDRIKFSDIHKNIKNSLSINANNYVNSVENILDYTSNYKKTLIKFYENI